MWKILVGFIIFAALAVFVIMKGGDKVDMQGEAGMHQSSDSHASAPAAASASADAAASVPAVPASSAAPAAPEPAAAAASASK